ncbi:hypothetical protein LINPERHAP1_LOCUS6627 [Linum perenne]
MALRYLPRVLPMSQLITNFHGATDMELHSVTYGNIWKGRNTLIFRNNFSP